MSILPFAIECRLFENCTPVTFTYIFYFKCLKYMFICFSYVTGQLKLWKTFSNTHSYICDRTLSYIIDFKCLKYDMWNSFVFVCCRKKNHQYTLRHLWSNAISPVFLLKDLDLHFRFQMISFQLTYLIILWKTIYFFTTIPGRVTMCILYHIAHKLGYLYTS